MKPTRANDILLSALVVILLFLTVRHARHATRTEISPATPAVRTAPPGRVPSPGRPSAPSLPARPQRQRLHTDIRFNGRRIKSDPNAQNAMRIFCRQMLPHESAPVLVGLPTIPSFLERERLADSGLTLLAYVADGGWVARVQGRAASLRQPVAAFVPITPDMRLSPSLMEPATCHDRPIYVHLLRGADGNAILRELHDAGMGALTLNRRGPFATIAGTVPTNCVAVLREIVGRNPDIQYAQGAGGARLLNSASVGILQSATPNGPAPFWDAGLYGSNQVIAVCDTGLDVDMSYFRDPSGALPPSNRVDGSTVNTNLRKVIAADFLYVGDNPANPLHWDNQDHGTFVCGCAAGAHIDTPFATNSFNGMAPGAKLIIQDGGFTVYDNCADLVGLGCPVTNFYPALAQAIRQGAAIHNNSWGDNENGTLGDRNAYSPCSRELDLIAWSNRQFLVVCAAGNDGPDHNVVASPSTAKNSLSVAACNAGTAMETVASFSSRGWTDDGRIKPDLVAPGGFGIRSANSDGNITTRNHGTKTGGGTSYSSPMIAGIAAIVRDYFAQGFHPKRVKEPLNAMPNVSAALTKAVLINSAQNMTGTATAPPARDQGWGRVNLSDTLPLPGSGRHLRVADGEAAFDSTSNGPFMLTVDVTATNHPLKVTLVWTDYPSTPGAGKHLVNDLDLVVSTPGATFKGNVLANGWSVTGGTPDRTNNVEQVVWMPDTTGLVQIAVAPFVIPHPTQDFALVVSGAFAPAPAGQDADGDDLPDVWELTHFPDLSHDGHGDADSDGVSNRDELLSGTDPVDARDHLRFDHASGRTSPDETVLSWTTVTNRTYTLKWRSNLVQGSWIALASNIPAPSDRTTVTIDTHRVRGAYYRVQVEGDDATP